jgi:putative ABC transport system permease protein
MRWLSQTFAVISLGIRTIPQRWSSSIVGVIGIAGVVVVFVSVLAIGEGFKAVLVKAGHPAGAIVLRNGSSQEMTSALTGAETDIIKQAPGLARDGGRARAAAEMFVIINLPRRGMNSPTNVPVRGTEPDSFKVRDGLTIVEGRNFTPGTNEAIVGRAATRQFDVDLGRAVKSGQLTLNVVGVFTMNGSAAESEIWCDSHILQGVYQRGNTYQTVLARLDSPASFDAFKNWLTSNRQLSVNAKREAEYYASQTEVMTGLVNGIGYVIAMLMAIGAVFGAILTMYTAVATRTREIATLRALGFNTASVLTSVLGESLVLAGVGGAIGGSLAYLGFNGYETATMNFQSFSEIAFAFHVTPALLIQGLIYALVMGLVGGVFPAIRAARLPIATALREL